MMENKRDVFDFNIGVKQEDILSAMLFNAGLHSVVEMIWHSQTMFHKPFQMWAVSLMNGKLHERK